MFTRRFIGSLCIFTAVVLLGSQIDFRGIAIFHTNRVSSFGTPQLAAPLPGGWLGQIERDLAPFLGGISPTDIESATNLHPSVWRVLIYDNIIYMQDSKTRTQERENAHPVSVMNLHGKERELLQTIAKDSYCRSNLLRMTSYNMS